MATPTQLNASHTIISGNGLAVSPSLISSITLFDSNSPMVTLANIFSIVNMANANVKSNISNSVANIGVGVTNNAWLLDLYPSNVTPACSANIVYYGNIYGGNVYAARFSETIQNQALAPFSYGMSGFANVYGTVFGYINSAFDIVASANLAQNKTYSQTGIGSTGPHDVVTMGVGNTAPLLSNVVSNFGTMYDITQISNLGDPYIFGQNLLNQGLGIYGNLSTQLSNVGLNITNLSAIPQNSSTSSQQIGTIPSQTPIGQIDLPFQQTVTATTVVSGNSTDVILSIYKSVTGADLDAIIAATQIVTPINSPINTLADFLVLKNVISPSNFSQLQSLSVVDFTSFGPYLRSKVGKGQYTSWSDLSDFLKSLEIPNLNYTASNSSTTVLSNSTINAIKSTYGVGSGPFGNPIVVDLLGAVNGYKYIADFSTLNNNYATIASSINLSTLVTQLQSNILTYVNYPGGMGNANVLSNINSGVTSINSALNSIPVSTTATNCNNAFYDMLSQLQHEVTNLSRASVVFNSGTVLGLNNFAGRIGDTASDKVQFETYQFFANLITNDVYGDTIRSVIAESINTSLTQAKGFNVTNNPNPTLVIYQSQAQNIPLSAYISQNQ